MSIFICGEVDGIIIIENAEKGKGEMWTKKYPLAESYQCCYTLSRQLNRHGIMVKKEDITPVMKVEMFRWLDGLRASGKVNMFGAAPYLQDAFDIDSMKTARAICIEWMESFKG